MRPSWDSYFMQIVDIVKERSTCLRRKVGALIVKDKRILATGYNGAPTDLPHCDMVGCMREKLNVPSGQRHELCRGLHAEQNAIIQAAKMGVNIDGSVIYTTTYPCIICAKMIINAGIKKVIYKGSYHDEMSEKIVEEAGIDVIQFEDDNEGVKKND